MDVTKTPAPGTAGAGAPSSAPQNTQSPARMAAIADQADIRPLDVPAALQILLAEVRASFELLAISMGGDAGGTGAESPAQAAHALLQMVLQAVPVERASTSASGGGQGSAARWNVEQWNAALERVEGALQAGLDRGINAVSIWREVPVSAVDATKETRAMVVAILGDDPQNPIWLRPEWVGLAPRFERFWRRRRFVLRQLTDPDHSSWSLDDGSEPRT
jgi:hypothetical protein